MASHTALQLLSQLPHDTEIQVLAEIPLLTDKINLADALARHGHYRTIAFILENPKIYLITNDQFCKHIFKSVEFEGEYRSPTSLRPQDGNPNGLTWHALIHQAAAQGDHVERQRLEAGRTKAISKHRLDCLLQSRLYREGRDRPVQSVKRKHDLPRSEKHTYSEWIQSYQDSGNMDLAWNLKGDRELQDAGGGQERRKAIRILATLKDIATNGRFLTHTCRGCGNEAGLIKAGVAVPYCNTCIDIYANQNMISNAELGLYQISIANRPSLYPVGFTLLRLPGDTFTTKSDADMLTKMYHGGTLIEIRGQVASGNLVALQLQQNSAIYNVASQVAREAAQMLYFYKSGKVASCFGLYHGQDLGHALTQTGLWPAAMTCISACLNPDIYTVEFWTKVISFAKDRAVSSGSPINILSQNHFWRSEAAAKYWRWTLRNDHKRHLLSTAHTRYQVLRVEKLVFEPTQNSPKLDACTMTIDEVEELCVKIHGASRTKALEMVQIDASGAKTRLNAYVSHSAALIKALMLYDKEFAAIWIDLVALLCRRGRDISTAEQRFAIFEDLARHFFSTSWTNEPSVVLESHLAVLYNNALSFDNWFRDEPQFFKQLQSCAEYLGEIRFLVPHDILNGQKDRMPQILKVALELGSISFTDKRHPNVELNCRVGRVAWFERSADVLSSL